MPLYPPSSVIANLEYTFDQQATPTPYAIGNTWRERDSLNNVALTWWWNGAYWVSTQLFQFFVIINGGNNITNSSGGFAFTPGSTYDFILIKIIGNFYITGLLSITNFWRLRFNLNPSQLYYIDFTSNTGTNANFMESEASFNNKLSNVGRIGNGYYNITFEAHGTSPSISSVSATIEYRLVHS